RRSWGSRSGSKRFGAAASWASGTWCSTTRARRWRWIRRPTSSKRTASNSAASLRRSSPWPRGTSCSEVAMIVEKGTPAPSPLGARRVERVVLTSSDLARHRQRVMTDAGRDIGISLPHGVALKDGDLLHLDAECAIVVEQAEEDLLWLQPQTPEQF